MIGELISIGKLSLKVAPAFVLVGLGLRYVFYRVDGWNLDRMYERHFKGRRKKKYRQFTQRVGLLFIVVGLIYFWIFVWPMVRSALDKHGISF